MAPALAILGCSEPKLSAEMVNDWVHLSCVALSGSIMYETENGGYLVSIAGRKSGTGRFLGLQRGPRLLLEQW